VIKKDFNSIHGFLLTFSRFFLIVLTYTVTAKLDKDAALSDTKEMHSQSKWLSALWPFWIYIAFFLILSVVALVTWLITVASFCNILLNPEEVKMGVLTHKNRKKRWSLFNRGESQD
jgi:hypothetical protein